MQPEIDIYENFKTYSSHLGPITGMLLTGRVEEYTNLLATCSLDGTILLTHPLTYLLTYLLTHSLM